METQRTIYKNEVIPISFTITDRLDNEFVPDLASVSIYDENNNLLGVEPCAIDINTITMVTTGSIFSNPGIYKLVWEITQIPYKFYHITNMKVEEW